jgi:chaperonin GroES
MMNLKPLGDRLIVEPIQQEEMTASGIVLPETAKEKPMQGKVLAAGPGARKEDGSRIPMDVSEGDTVLYAKYAGTEVKIGNDKYLILKETDVLAIVE